VLRAVIAVIGSAPGIMFSLNFSSQYLVERIRAADNIEVRLQTEVVAGSGDGHLEAITIADRAAGTKDECPSSDTEPKSSWPRGAGCWAVIIPANKTRSPAC